MTPLIDAEGISKRFVLHRNRAGQLKVRFLGMLQSRYRQTNEEFWALRDVSLKIARGESVGLVGRNGSGKSTFLKLVANIHRPTTGRLLVARHARIGTMIELGIGFHHELTGRENAYLSAAMHGLTRPEIDAIYDPIVEYSGLGSFMDVPLKNYSSGMHMRLGFAIAANLDPDILLLDEIFAVGDEDFRKRCIKTIETFRSQGKTILFVSHDAGAILQICPRVCVLDHGRLLFDGPAGEGLIAYHRVLTNDGVNPAV